MIYEQVIRKIYIYKRIIKRHIFEDEKIFVEPLSFSYYPLYVSNATIEDDTEIEEAIYRNIQKLNIKNYNVV
jgi:hypothetical protein